MVRHGSAPFLECSSKGDSRFSAFSAKVRSRGNRTIETIYQAAKKFEDGSTNLHWREAKGKRAVNMEEVASLYSTLWDEAISENQELLEVLMTASGVSDIFGQPGHACQATELWRIRCAALAAESIAETSSSPTEGAGPAASLEHHSPSPPIRAGGFKPR